MSQAESGDTAFFDRMQSVVRDGCINSGLAIGSQLGLFEAMVRLDQPFSPANLAEATACRTRYTIHITIVTERRSSHCTSFLSWYSHWLCQMSYLNLYLYTVLCPRCYYTHIYIYILYTYIANALTTRATGTFAILSTLRLPHHVAREIPDDYNSRPSRPTVLVLCQQSWIKPHF